MFHSLARGGGLYGEERFRGREGRGELWGFSTEGREMRQILHLPKPDLHTHQVFLATQFSKEADRRSSLWECENQSECVLNFERRTGKKMKEM